MWKTGPKGGTWPKAYLSEVHGKEVQIQAPITLEALAKERHLRPRKSHQHDFVASFMSMVAQKPHTPVRQFFKSESHGNCTKNPVGIGVNRVSPH